MDVDNKYKCLDEGVARFIRYKARQLVGRYGFTLADVEDLAQELVLDLLRRFSKYDPKCAKQRTFTRKIIDHKIASIAEARQAAKRDYNLNGGSLNDDIEDEDGHATQRQEQVDETACRRRLGWSSGPSEEQRDLAVHLSKAEAILPPELREVWERLKSGQRVTEIAKVMGKSRSSVYGRIDKIRAIFEDKELKDYL